MCTADQINLSDQLIDLYQQNNPYMLSFQTFHTHADGETLQYTTKYIEL